jgi:hypothetical protein
VCPSPNVCHCSAKKPLRNSPPCEPPQAVRHDRHRGSRRGCRWPRLAGRVPVAQSRRWRRPTRIRQDGSSWTEGIFTPTPGISTRYRRSCAIPEHNPGGRAERQEKVARPDASCGLSLPAVGPDSPGRQERHDHNTGGRNRSTLRPGPQTLLAVAPEEGEGGAATPEGYVKQPR